MSWHLHGMITTQSKCQKSPVCQDILQTRDDRITEAKLLSKILHLHFITDATLMIYNDQEYLNKKHEVYRKT